MRRRFERERVPGPSGRESPERKLQLRRLMSQIAGRDGELTREAVDPRVPLALERTFLAWIRTSLAMMGFGFVVARFGLFLRELERARGGAPAVRGISPLMGTALVALGTCTAAWSVIRFRRSLSDAASGSPPHGSAMTIPTLIATVLCAIGVATIWYFLTAS